MLLTGIRGDIFTKGLLKNNFPCTINAVSPRRSQEEQKKTEQCKRRAEKGMEVSEMHQCECAACQQETAHSDQERHRRINLLVSRLNEQQRRWYLAMESERLGTDGDEVLSHITGMAPKTIQRGRQELERELADRPRGRGRLAFRGTSSRRKKDPALESTLEGLVVPETAWDPMSEQKWVRSSLRHLSERLEGLGHVASPPTVGRL
jgi:hypothetical protein